MGHHTLKTEWIQLDAETASQHPLFGANGWISVFINAYVVGIIISLFLVFDPRNYGLGSFITSVYVFIAGYTLWMIFQFSKHEPQTLTKLFTYCAVGLVVSVVTALIEPNLFGSSYSTRRGYLQLTTDFIRALITAIIWVSYFHYSKRSNVTYRHRVKSTDAFLPDNNIDIPINQNAAADSAKSNLFTIIQNGFSQTWLLRTYMALQVMGIIGVIVLDNTSSSWDFIDGDFFRSRHWADGYNWLVLLLFSGPYALTKTVDWIIASKVK